MRFPRRVFSPGFAVARSSTPAALGTFSWFTEHQEVSLSTGRHALSPLPASLRVDEGEAERAGSGRGIR